jgi:hypothetical protein
MRRFDPGPRLQTHFHACRLTRSFPFTAFRVRISPAGSDARNSAQVRSRPAPPILRRTLHRVLRRRSASFTLAGAVFREVDCHGNVASTGLHLYSIAAIFKTAALRAGMNATNIAGHGVRAGMATQAVLNGSSKHLIARTWAAWCPRRWPQATSCRRCGSSVGDRREIDIRH